MKHGFWGIIWLLFCSVAVSNAQERFKIIAVNPKIIAESEVSSRKSEPEVYFLQLENKQDVSQIKHFKYFGNQWIAIEKKDLIAQNILNKYSWIQFGNLDPASKISNEFTIFPSVEKAWKGGSALKMVLFYFGIDEIALKNVLNLAGIEIIKSEPTFGKITIRAQQKNIIEIAQKTFVLHVSPVLEERTPLASTSFTMTRANKVQSNIGDGLGLTGAGIGIGVWDYGAAGNHVDFENSVLNVENEFYSVTGSQHTSQVAGAIAGRGVLSPDVVGIAPKSKVYVHNFFGDILEEMRQLYITKDVHVTNHSYNVGSTFACGVLYEYDAASAAMDQIALEYPNLVNVFAVGNSATGCPYSYGNVVPGFQYAKNVITVGWLQNNETLYPGSAKGPTSDGRLRPEIVTKGASTFSPNAGMILTGINQNYVGSFGSSFSSPQIAGIVGLLQQAALAQSKPYPDAALVKAVLCNTSKDLGNEGPDYEYGFGRVDAFKAIRSFQNNQYLQDSVINGQTKNFNITVPANTAQLKVMITWDDEVTSFPAAKILVNDLDLTVNDGVNTFKSWKLDPANPSATAIRGRDSLNNAEQVTINNPTAGIYTVSVNGFDIPIGAQSFSISYHFESNGADITFPDGKEVIANNLATFVRWTAFNTDSIVTVEFSRNGGSSWTSIGTTNASAGFISWTTPAGGYTDSALVRIRNGANIWATSDSMFTLMGRVNVSGQLQCNSGIRLSWPAVDSAQGYVISRYENEIWIPEDTVTTLLYNKRNAELGKEYILAVSPIRKGKLGPRSAAARLTARFGNCGFIGKDLALVGIRPISGRKLTSKVLLNSERIKVKYYNISNVTANYSIKMSWQVNGGTIYDSTFNINLVAGASAWFTSGNTFNMSDTGNYSIKAWITSTGDIEPLNDTIYASIRQIPNTIINLPFEEKFETTPFSFVDSVIGIPNLERFDFYPQYTARASSYGGQIFSPEGLRSLNLDNYSDKDSAISNFIATLNLSAYIDSLVYFDFKYRARGESAGRDKVYVRGNDTLPWLEVYDLFTNAPANAAINDVKRINISEALDQGGQQFSTSTQINISAFTTKASASINTAGGYNIDDYYLFCPGTDASLENIQYPTIACLGNGITSKSIQIGAVVKNNAVDSLKNIQLFFQSPDTLYQVSTLNIEGFGQKNVSFPVTINFDSTRKAFFNIWIEANGDRLSENDSLLNNKVLWIDSIASLPYENSFETDAVLPFVSDGSNSSWQLGSPTSTIINNAAEGQYAWVTNLSGNYNAFENSYLYIGCILPSKFSSSGQIAFEHIYKMEATFDKATLQVSNDMVNWVPLGKKNAGYNWFNQASGSSAWDGERSIWQVASYTISPDSFASANSAYLRFAFNADEVQEFEGFGLDDIRILASTDAITRPDSLVYHAKSTGVGTVLFKNDSLKVVARINDNGQSLDSMHLSVKSSSQCVPIRENYFLLPRKYYLKSDQSAITPIQLKLYITNEEYLRLLAADTSIKGMRDIGIWLYNGINTDDTLYNNAGVGYTYLPPDSVRFLPYSQGYEVVFNSPFSNCEIYFRGINSALSTPVPVLNFASIIPNIIQDSIIPTFKVKLECSGGFTYKDCNNGSVSLQFLGCGVQGNLTQPVINGEATFASLKIVRSPQANLKFIATYSGACTGILKDTSNAFSVTTNPAFADSLPMLLGSNDTICSGDSLQFSPNIQYASLPVQYFWSPSLGLNDSSFSNPTASPVNTTLYQLRVVDNDDCVDTATFEIQVDSPAVINIQPQLTSACHTLFTVAATNVALYNWQMNSTGTWQNISISDTDFDDFDTDSLIISANSNNYDSVYFRATLTQGACNLMTDSVPYYSQPFIVLPTSGSWILNNGCDIGHWTYYGFDSVPGQYILGINWAPDNSLSTENAIARAAAVVTLKVDPQFYLDTSFISLEPFGTFTMNRYWNVDVSGNPLSEPVQVKFYYELAEKQAVENAANTWVLSHPGSNYEGFEWFKTISGAFDPISDVQPENVMNAIALTDLNAGDLLENGILYALFDSVTSFSGGTGATGVGPLDTPLPVTLLGFSAICKNERSELFWQTMSEFNNQFFEIEHSVDGINYSSIQKIPAAGTSNALLNYTLTHLEPSQGINYYRLSQTDYNGAKTILKVVSTDCNFMNEYWKATYFPVKGITVNTYLTLPRKISWQLIDVAGRVIAFDQKLLPTGISEFTIPSESLSKGIYFLKITDLQQSRTFQFSIY